MATMQVELVSPERVVFSGEATHVVTRTLAGDIAFLPGHTPFLGALTESHTRVFLADGGVLDVAVHGGFVEVSPTKVSILSDLAELGSEIDVPRARAKMEATEASLASDHDVETEAALRRAKARLAAAEGPEHRR